MINNETLQRRTFHTKVANKLFFGETNVMCKPPLYHCILEAIVFL